MQDLIGVGAALRKARTKRGLSLDEASRATRVRIDQLQALEDEEFELLGGDVYVRGCLRTYAGFLGLSPDRVVDLYARHAEEPEGHAPPASPMGSVEKAMTASRARDNQRLIVVGTVMLLVLALLFGFLSRQRTAPEPAALQTQAQQPELDREITADMVAGRDTSVTVTKDGALAETIPLAEGEALSIKATSTLVVRIDPGGSVHLTVNGVDYGRPGRPGNPWQRSFSYEAPGTATSSAGG